MRISKRRLRVIIATTLILCVGVAGIKYKLNRTARRYAVRPMNRKRDEEGFFATLIKDMIYKEEDNEQFFKYTRMSPAQFNYLLSLVKPRLQKQENRRPISPAQRLIMTLHYLAEGCSMQELAWGYRVGKTTVHKVIRETCTVLWNVLMPLYLKAPTTEKWLEISNGFYKRWNMPHCVGAVDGKHVNIKAPKKSGSRFFNYKKNFSLVLMAVCDSYYRFTLVDIGGAGSNHDSAVFKSSSFGEALLNKNLGLPKLQNLPNTNIKMNYFMVGDAAFPLHINIMRPYPGTNLGDVKNTFNYRLSRARRCIENTFGILSARWLILRRTINASLDTCEKIVQATTVLHNFLQNSELNIPLMSRNYCPTGFADYFDRDGNLNPGYWRNENIKLRSVSRLGSNHAQKSVVAMRNTLAQYFMAKEGWVPWQEDKIYRGGAPDLI